MATAIAESNGIQAGEATGNAGGGRRKSAFAGRRKSSAVIVDEKPAAIVQATELSEADRRLAEMGYVQVSRIPLSVSFSWLSCCKNHANARGRHS